MKRRELRRRIRAKYDTIGDFADDIGVSRTAVNYWLSGKTDPSRVNLEQMARLLDVKQEEMWGLIFPEG